MTPGGKYGAGQLFSADGGDGKSDVCRSAADRHAAGGIRDGAQARRTRISRRSTLCGWTGRPDSRRGGCYLCSLSNINGNLMMTVPVPTLMDDVLYITTGQWGADCALDANVGRILWLRITGSGNRFCFDFEHLCRRGNSIRRWLRGMTLWRRMGARCGSTTDGRGS